MMRYVVSGHAHIHGEGSGAPLPGRTAPAGAGRGRYRGKGEYERLSESGTDREEDDAAEGCHGVFGGGPVRRAIGGGRLRQSGG